MREPGRLADYNAALQLNPQFNLAYNNRGAAYKRKGDLDRAIADYEQAVRLSPRDDTAAENLAAVRLQRDRLAMVDPRKGPSFDCKTAKAPVEKAVCSDEDLAALDRNVDSAYQATLGRLNGKQADNLRSEQRTFIATRNRLFGRPDYQFKKEMERRLGQLQAMAR